MLQGRVTTLESLNYASALNTQKRNYIFWFVGPNPKIGMPMYPLRNQVPHSLIKGCLFFVFFFYFCVFFLLFQRGEMEICD